jgi:transposase
VEHIAVDLGKKESQVCRRGEDGKIREEGKISTLAIGEYLAGKPRARVILETCAEAFDVADEVMELGHEVRVVPSKLAPSLGVGSHGIKTDRRDAQNLSKASVRMDDLGSVHIPSKVSREQKSLVAMRGNLVEARTSLINTTRGYLRTRRIHMRSGGAATFTKRVRETIRKEQLEMPAAVERHLGTIDLLTAQIGEADEELGQIAEADSTCTLLMSMPGVGPVTSILFKATIDDLSRFPSGHRMASYLGQAPGEDSSSTRQRTTSITKAGPTRLRWMLVQAAWSFYRTRRHEPLVVWAEAVARRRGIKVAIVALARRMAEVLRAMWRNGKPYDPLYWSPPPNLPPQVIVARDAGAKIAARTPKKPK